MLTLIQDFLTGTSDNILGLKKEIEKNLVSHIFAHAKLQEIQPYIEQYQANSAHIIEETQVNMQRIVKQLDDTIQGEWGSKVQDTLREVSQRYASSE